MRNFLLAVVFVSALGALGCVHPLGPGYHFLDRQAEIRVRDGTSGGIHFRIVDRLQNSGDRTLRSLEVRLPEGPAFGEPSVRVQIEGTEVFPRPVSGIDLRRMRAPFDPAWKQNDVREVVAEWDLAPVTLARGTIATSTNGFFIADETALPIYETPRGIFPRGGANPDKEFLTVSAPADFRVLAPGKPLKIATRGNENTHPFQIDPKKDFLPYVVAGRYHEKMMNTRQGEVQFWTFNPLDDGAAEILAERVSASGEALSDFFGPTSNAEKAVRIVESPVELPAEFASQDDPGGISFPQGVLLDPRIVQQGLASEAVMELSEYELTRTWFGWIVRPSADAQILMGRGVGLFGLVVAAESRGMEERGRKVASLIDRYDKARAMAPDKRLMEPPVGYTRAERVSTGYRGALFFVALEDVCGRDNLAAALRSIIYARSGSETSYQELRAAVETESHKDLADMFRLWLVQPGIPQEFRAKYRPVPRAAFAEPVRRVRQADAKN